MKKRSVFLGIMLLLSSNALWAQDSLQVVSKKWNQEKIGKGVIWKQGHFTDLFGSEQEINWVEINLKKKKVALAADAKKLRKTTDFAEENRALVAINGGFFDMKNGGAVDYIRVNGKIVNSTQGKSARANAVLGISGKKNRIESSNEVNTEQAPDTHVMLSGPLLLSENKEVVLDKNPFNSNRHPRTAVGLKGKKKFILMVVDGRFKEANGMSLPELSKVMKWIGATSAMNLDGGGSSAMYIRGKGIVTYPSDNKTFDHAGERSVANIVYIP